MWRRQKRQHCVSVNLYIERWLEKAMYTVFACKYKSVARYIAVDARTSGWPVHGSSLHRWSLSNSMIQARTQLATYPHTLPPYLPWPRPLPMHVARLPDPRPALVLALSPSLHAPAPSLRRYRRQGSPPAHSVSAFIRCLRRVTHTAHGQPYMGPLKRRSPSGG